MTLKNNLYTIVASEPEARCFTLALNADHVIYRAHFPGQPITPGVCLVQMAQELLSEHLGRPLSIKAVKNVKFLAIVSPQATPQVDYILTKIQESDGEVAAQVVVTSDQQAMAKISLTCAG